MALIDELRTQFGRLNDPNFTKQLIAERQAQFRPDLERSFKKIDARLAEQGLFSASPVTRSRFRAAGEFERGISQDVQGDINRRFEVIAPLLAQLELAEKQGRTADKAGIFKLIGTILGTGAGFLIGGPPGAAIGGGIGGSAGGSFSNLSAPRFNIPR